ncbi:MAG: DUF4368 domain-containing protein [Clostridiales bacterium]|nr:DUF4368 domain-containing protein [Clostridiales bacterium]
MDQQKITILYCRLSNEDSADGESNSIANQRTVLSRYAAEQGFTNIKILVDDGYTGTNFNRPAVKEGLELVEQGLVGCWIVKDMSRFGRDYLQVGQYTELFFPSYDVRFIAVNDGVDSDKGDNDFTPIRNLFNDFYAKDTSKKVRAILRARGTSGKHMNRPPYGYKEDPDNRGYWLIDEEAAAVVKRIFDLCIAGKGPEQIARILEKDKVLTTRAYQARKKGKPLPEHPYRWADPSIVGILERMEYNGCTCNFKTYSRSYKLKKRIPNKPEDMLIIPDTQEAIVSKEQWDRVQELRKHRHRRVKGDRQGLFSSLLYCADCGSKLHYCTCKSFEGNQNHYVCSQYKSGRGDCSAHYIREEVLRDLVLERIQAVNAYIREDAESFQEEWMQCQRDGQEKSIREDRKRIAKAKKRLSDIDTLLTSIYEDSVLGNLSKERYRQMAENYEAEQEQLKTEIAVLEELVETREETNHNYDQFHALTEKYVDVKELTPTIVNEYIKKIIIYAPDKSTGKRRQKIKIIFNFVDEVDIPAINEPIIYEQSKNSRKTA